jgi:hypothetical protein
MNRSTIFSGDRVYRYTLWREWDSALPFVQFIGLNPSTADESQDDPTIRRCIAFSKLWGFGSLCMTNLFAFRATDPTEMKSAKEPIGLDNDVHLRKVAHEAGIIVAAWGAGGGFMGRGIVVKGFINELRKGLKLSALKAIRILPGGLPQHPLFLRTDLLPGEYP